MSPLEMVDDELGLVRYCRRCEEWQPLDEEFWYFETRGGSRVPHCRTCKRSGKSGQYERLRLQVEEVRLARHHCEECRVIKTRRHLCCGCARRLAGPLTVARLAELGLAGAV